MSLEKIKQNAKTINEGLTNYDALVQQGIGATKKEIREIDKKLKKLNEYMLKLASEIDKLVKEEKKELEKNAR